jgi:hypothetical protein
MFFVNIFFGAQLIFTIYFLWSYHGLMISGGEFDKLNRGYLSRSKCHHLNYF